MLTLEFARACLATSGRGAYVRSCRLAIRCQYKGPTFVSWLNSWTIRVVSTLSMLSSGCRRCCVKAVLAPRVMIGSVDYAVPGTESRIMKSSEQFLSLSRSIVTLYTVRQNVGTMTWNWKIKQTKKDVHISDCTLCTLCVYIFVIVRLYICMSSMDTSNENKWIFGSSFLRSLSLFLHHPPPPPFLSFCPSSHLSLCLSPPLPPPSPWVWVCRCFASVISTATLYFNTFHSTWCMFERATRSTNNTYTHPFTLSRHTSISNTISTAQVVQVDWFSFHTRSIRNWKPKWFCSHRKLRITNVKMDKHNWNHDDGERSERYLHVKPQRTARTKQKTEGQLKERRNVGLYVHRNH